MVKSGAAPLIASAFRRVRRSTSTVIGLGGVNQRAQPER
jgi:hypothetical protein